jgi:hypothetical protein
MTLIWRKSTIAAKIETTAGSIESLTNAEGVFNAFNSVINPDATFEERPAQGSYGHMPGVVGMRSGTMTFTTELFGDGAGGVPGWASTLLPACGWVNSAGVFTPRTEAPGSNVKTVTIAKYENGVAKRLRGAMGMFSIVMAVGNRVLINWTFRGAWQAPEDVALLAPTYPTRSPMRATGTYTLASAAHCFSSMTINSGNNLILRPCITASDGSGIATAHVGNRLPTGSFDPESKLVATDDRYGRWLAGTEQALSIAFADAADTITIAAPKVQIRNPQEADREGLQVDNIEFQCNKNSGDDELSITFAGTT